MTGVEITKPGVYDGVPDHIYHGDPVPGGSLSSSGARKLLPPSCPAVFKYELDNPPPPKKPFDLGHAAHKQVLGAGPTLTPVDATDWRTKAARAARDQAHADGRVPLLRAEYEQVEAMAAAIRAHPVAAALFDPAHGRPEQSLFWTDPDTGLWLRARLDWLPAEVPGRRLIVPDYKTCASADLRALERAIAGYGYHQQAAWYLDAVAALGLGGDAAFVFVAQEKTPPYLITVVELDQAALSLGRTVNRWAIGTWRDCRETGRWPPYADGIELITLPPWALNRLEYM